MAGETAADGIVLSNTGLGNGSSIDQAAAQAIIDQVESHSTRGCHSIQPINSI